MKYLSLLLAFLLLNTFSHAQQEGGQSCGTQEVPESILQYLENIDYSLETGENTINVPVTVHIIRTDQGSGSFSPARALDGLCNVNERFSTANMNFFVAGDIHFIDNTNYLNVTSYAITNTLIADNNVPGTVNIYYTNLSAMGLCGFAYYPNSGPGGTNNRGAVVMSFACSQPTGTTLAHELGHFFALPHTFDRTSGNPLHPTNAERVTRDVNDTIGGRLGANCNTGGDRFCDTPSDFIGNRWSCPTGIYQEDINGDRIRPDSSYYMSYANDICTSRFSEQQIIAMRNTLANATASRGYLLDPPMPAYTDLTTAPALLLPAEGDSNIAGNYAYFKWTAVPGATFYNFKVFQFGGVLMDTLIYDTVYLNLGTNIRANRTLQWEVRAMNPSNLCAPISPRGTFKTGNFTPLALTNTFDEKLKMYPTFLKAGEILTFEGLMPGELELQCNDLSGKRVYGTSLQVDNERAELTIGQWPSGVYLLQVKQGSQQTYRKIVVQP